MFISREMYLKIFRAIDEKLQDINLSKVGRKELSRIFNIDENSAKYVKDNYPNLLSVHKIIYAHYCDKYIVFENSKGDKFTLSYSYYDNNFTKNRWKEFKQNMLIK